MAPVLAVGLRFFQAIARLRRHQCRVENLKLGTGSLLPDYFTGILLQPTDHAHAREQVQIVRQRRCVASVLQLPKHLGVRQNLTGISASQPGRRMSWLRHSSHPRRTQRLRGKSAPAAGLSGTCGCRCRRGKTGSSDNDTVHFRGLGAALKSYMISKRVWRRQPAPA